MPASPITSGALPDADHLPEGEEKTRAVRAMFDTIAPRYDLVNRLMTFRMDVGWRRTTVTRLDLPEGSTVADLACGTGDLCRELAASGLDPIGVDLSFGMLAAARTEAPLVHADITHLPMPAASIDGATCGFALRNLADLGGFFVELGRVIKAGGRIALLEVAQPPNPVMRWGHGIYFGKVVPRIGGLLSDGAAYRYLPKSVAYLPEPDDMLAMLAAAGFVGPRRDLLSGGIAQLLTADPVADLVAVTTQVDDVDLVAFGGDASDGVVFSRSGIGLAGRGVAWRGPVGDAPAVLASIAVDGESRPTGTGPVAFAALPFDPRRQGEAVIPSLVVVRAEDGTGWATRITPEGLAPDPAVGVAASPNEPPPAEPDEFTTRPGRTPESWCAAVAEATSRMRAGQLEKAVLAREIVVSANRPFVVGQVLRRLERAYPSCFVYGVDGYVGASPELLVERNGDVVSAQPMAGTTARRGDPEADARAAAALLASPVYRHEHQVTIDMVHDTLLPFCSYLDDEPEPSVVPLANVAHLATRVEGRLSHPPASVLELVAALHPTPAVCGRPRTAALDLITELEGFDRGHYAGAVGWVDAGGNGQWAVAIRGTQIDGATALVYAGNGILADSDPIVELAETRAKLQAVLSALIRP